MSDSPLILGVSGLRGIVGESLTPEVAVRYAGAFAEWLRERRQGEPALVAVGRDGRAGGESLSQIVVDALQDAGCKVTDCGVTMTPSMGHEVDHCMFTAAIVVTASHNPAEWNGLKLLVSEEVLRGNLGSVEGACAPPASVASEVISRFQETTAPVIREGGAAKADGSPEGSHVEDVISFLPPALKSDGFRSVSVVMDSVNCSGAIGSAALLDRMGVRFTQLHGDGSGIFPHTPEPTRENLSGEGGLCDAVPGLKADVGFAQDPDADRLAIIDETGHYIGEEYTLVLCAAALMEGRRASGESASGTPVFVANLSTSRMIDDVAKHYGAEVVRTAVGEANVVEAMKRLTAEGRDVVMGGEGNGGVIWAEVTYVRDSLSAMALTLALMARTGKTVSELVAMIDGMGPGGSGYAIVKRKAPLASKADADPAVRHLAGVWGKDGSARVDTQDGVRVDWDDRGVWAHVRASNTEPIMRVIVEAPTQDEADRVADDVQAEIARA